MWIPWLDFILLFQNKDILHRLNKGNLIPDTDDLFLKVYVAMEIEAKELYPESKGFQQDTNTTYSDTLELTHADFCI